MAKTNTTTLVIKINDKDVQKSFTGISKELKSLQSDLKKLTPDTDAYFKKLKEIDNATKAFATFQKQQQAVEKEFQKLNNSGSSALNNLKTTGVSAAKSLDSSFSGFFSKLLSGATAFLGISSIFSWVEKGIEKFEKAEMTTERLSNALHNLGGNSKDAKILEDSITSLTSKYTYLNKVDFQEIQKKLVTWGKLSAKQITDLQPLIVDFAANARISLDEATDTIIKGVEGNARALKVYGINVKDAGSESERFSLIQKELAKRVEGSAEIFQNSSEGKIETYKKQIGSLQKQIGEQLMPVYDAFLDTSISVIKVIKQIDFSNIIKGITTLATIWLIYRTYVMAASVATGIKNTLLLANMIITGENTTAVGLNTTAELANGTVIKSNTILIYLVIAAKQIWATATRTITAETTLLSAALTWLSRVMVVLPIAALIIGLIKLVAAHQQVSDKVRQQIKIQEDLNKITQDAAKNSASELAHMKELYKTATDKAAADDKRREAIKQLQEEYPSYFKNMDLEAFKNGTTKKSYEELTDAIIASSKAKAAQAIIDEKARRLEEIKQIEDIAKAKSKQRQKTNGDIFSAEAWKQDLQEVGSWFGMGDGDDESTFEAITQEKKDLEAFFKDKTNAIFKTVKDSTAKASKYDKDKADAEPGLKTNFTPPKDKEKDKTADDLEKARDAYNKALEAKSEANKKMLELQANFEDEKLKIIEESRQKELKQEDLSFEKRKQDLESENVEIQNKIRESNTQIQKLQRDAKETKSPAAKSTYNAAIKELEETNKKRIELTNINNSILVQINETHFYNVSKINEKWLGKAYAATVEAEQKLIEKQRQRDEEEITNIDSLAKAKASLKDNEYLKLTSQELDGIRTLEDAKAALREAADRKMLAAQLVSLENQKKTLVEFIASLADGDAKKQLLKDLDTLSAKISQVKAAFKGGGDADDKKVTEESDDAKSKLDILGFSAKDWEKAWDNLDTTAGKIEAAKMAVQALGNAFSAYADLQNNLNQKELKQFTAVQEKKKASLLKELNQGWITQEEYNKNVQKIDAETANKKAEIEYKAAKTQRAVQIASAIANTAIGVVSALAMNPWTPANYVLAGIVGALGAVQIATIASTPLPDKPSYAEGGFTGSGFGMPDETGFKPAGIVHAGEWVAPEWMTQDPRTANVIGYLESVRTGNTKPMAEGGFADGNATTPVSSNSTNTSDNSELTGVLRDLKDVLKKIKDEGIFAYILKNARTGKDLQEMIDDYETLKNKNKH